MQKADIIIGDEYGLREVRKATTPLHRVRILQHVRGKKWKAEWIEPNPGLVDYVEAQNLVVRWSDANAFEADEKAESRLRKDNEQHGYDEETPVADALYSVFDSTGDKLSFYRGDLSGTREALERVRKRAGIDPATHSALEYVDRRDVVHVPFAEALELAKSFCAAEPDTVQTYIEPTERKWAREASTKGDDSMMALLSKYRAASALIRQWMARDPSASLRHEVERLQRLVLDAMYALQRAGLDQVALRLREELGHAEDRNAP